MLNWNTNGALIFYQIEIMALHTHLPTTLAPTQLFFFRPAVVTLWLTHDYP